MEIVSLPITVLAICTLDKPHYPYKFKYKDARGDETKVKVDFVERIETRHKDYILYYCASLFGNIKRRYQLRFWIYKCKWDLYKIS